MRCGILIIGSLLWDSGKQGERAAWRATRLDVSAQIPVYASFYYGRKSRRRGDTFTMTFETGEPSAHGVLAPCAKEVETINDLIEEAKALWRAEDAKATSGTIGKGWGCVGALFRLNTVNGKLVADWTARFRKMNAQGVSVVDSKGMLNIPWPNTLDGQPVDFDVILATATKPEAERPTVRAVADAWIDQSNEQEAYFFNNVQHGIRTPDDCEIWRRIEERSPSWLKTAAYKEAIESLRRESAARNKR